MLTATFVTSDSKDQVVAFYQNALGPNAQASSNTNGESFMLNKGAGESVIVTVSQSALRDQGKTQIVVVHSTKADAATTPGTQARRCQQPKVRRCLQLRVRKRALGSGND